MNKKINGILDKAEDVVLKKIADYEKNVHEMDKDDCYALQLLVITAGRIVSIREGADRNVPL